MTCSSSNRCRSTSCDTCRWRYAGQIARRILPDARRFFSIEIEIGDVSFRAWAAQVRNVFEYRRSESRWWNEVSLTVWHCRDQRARGVVALGPILEAELVEALDRWPTTLPPIAPEDVRTTIYHALRPDRIAIIPTGRRYQSISFYIGPRLPTFGVPQRCEPVAKAVEIAAMPWVF